MTTLRQLVVNVLAEKLEKLKWEAVEHFTKVFERPEGHDYRLNLADLVVSSAINRIVVVAGDILLQNSTNFPLPFDAVMAAWSMFTTCPGSFDRIYRAACARQWSRSRVVNEVRHAKKN